MYKLIFLILCSAAIAQNPYRSLNNFNAGELSPLLSAREDLAKYQNGCSVIENLVCLPQGGLQKRPGTKYIAEVKTSSLATRIIPFEFSTSQSYIIELGNQYMRFYTNAAQITLGSGLESITVGSIVVHWLCNDNLATTAVLDDDGNTHDGVMYNSINTNAVHAAGHVGTGSFNFGGANYFTVSHAATLSFGDGVDDDPLSIAAWVQFIPASVSQVIVGKADSSTVGEYRFRISAANKFILELIDDSTNVQATRTADDALIAGWHFLVATYDGSDSANGIILYIDGSVAASTAATHGDYNAMEVQSAIDLAVGAESDGDKLFLGKIDNVLMTSDVLASGEITTLYAAGAYEIATPYLTADLFELKYEQSADVIYITHPDYETRKLAREANIAWSLEVIGIDSGPFRRQNIDETKTLSVTGTLTKGSSVTLQASGHSPFIATTAAGHIPSGANPTHKSQTGALFRLIHPIGTMAITERTLNDNYGNDSTEGKSWMDLGTLYKDGEWSVVTTGTWTGTFEIQRNYVIGAGHAASGWEKVLQYKSKEDRNVVTTGTEDDGDASYRAILTASGDGSETCKVNFSTDQTEVVGVVKITAITDGDTATATVMKTIGGVSGDVTHKWSEGSWSNYRGWPRTVTFFEDRLCFGGNKAQPDTIWTSVTSDYENMTAGPDDDEALLFTLSSRQVNVIEWIIGKDKLLIGTSGGEWTIAGGTDEPLTPSGTAKQHSTYGSANLQATLANESILFFQRGAEKMRELAYNWELDSYVAPDMTILANLVTNGGIVDTSFQKTPDSILWCVRADGELPVFSYERKENITAWSRMVTQTNRAGTLTDSDFESIAKISGSPEDEVWVVVERIMADVNSGNPVRYIEQFQPRDFGSDAEDAFYVDAGVSWSSGTASSAMTGLSHLNGQTVYVLADGVVFDTEVVAGGAITLSLDNVTTTAKTVQMGLTYEVHMRTMPLSWVAEGMTIQGRQKRISEVVVNWYNSGDFSIGRDASTLRSQSISGQATGQDRVTFPPGYSREGYIYIFQKSPEPLTLLAVMVEFNVN